MAFRPGAAPLESLPVPSGVRADGTTAASRATVARSDIAGRASPVATLAAGPTAFPSGVTAEGSGRAGPAHVCDGILANGTREIRGQARGPCWGTAGLAGWVGTASGETWGGQGTITALPHLAWRPVRRPGGRPIARARPWCARRGRGEPAAAELRPACQGRRRRSAA